MAARFKINENENATLSGVHYQQIRDIITAAALNCYECLEKETSSPDMKQFAEQMLKNIENIKNAIDVGIDNTFPKKSNMPLTKAQRLQKVKEEKRVRILIETMLN